MTSSAPPPEAVRVAVFAKAPVAGTVKTRLTHLLGPDGAAGLHAGLVRHALATAAQARVGTVELWCSPDETHPFFERCAREFGARLKRQRGANLGERMRHAIESGRAEGSTIILIGSDCPALTGAHLDAAAAALSSHEVVIIPAEDGGYVLVGMSASVPAIFDAIPWGTAAVMAETRQRLGHAGVLWKELPALWDVDRPEDYARLQREGLLREVLS